MHFAQLPFRPAASLLVSLAATTLLAATPAPAPAPTPSPDPAAEKLFASARAAWARATLPPFVRYAALVRYQHGSHVVDTWWEAFFRSSDDRLLLNRLHDAQLENRRNRGIAFSIFGFQVADTNGDAEPIRIDDPRFSPDDAFGVRSRAAAVSLPDISSTPLPGASSLPQLGRVEATNRTYRITLVGTETVGNAQGTHLHLEPIDDPRENRLRDLWIDPATGRTLRVRVAGILRGKPYDGVPWRIDYVSIDGANVIQQIVAEAPLKFGVDTVIPKYEFDFVDYRFSATAPPFTFEPEGARPIGAPRGFGGP